jgi:hypothetical protein
VAEGVGGLADALEKSGGAVGVERAGRDGLSDSGNGSKDGRAVGQGASAGAGNWVNLVHAASSLIELLVGAT